MTKMLACVEWQGETLTLHYRYLAAGSRRYTRCIRALIMVVSGPEAKINHQSRESLCGKSSCRSCSESSRRS
jgi:hypothetical protein